MLDKELVSEKDRAFETLEGLRRKGAEIDYRKELEYYRQEKYGTDEFCLTNADLML